ncbi:MAG: lipase family protein [Clostridiales bacterium]|nr:lipase family protein [Clostridiales bacterium]
MTSYALLETLELAALAYRSVQPDLPPTTLFVIDDQLSGVQCYLRSRDQLLDITFRGTDSLRDALNNLRVWKKTVPYGNQVSPIRVHTGFISAYKSPAVRDRIQSFMTPEVRRVRISGHSLGAALALLCAVDLEYNFPDRAYEVVVFGCPRVGNDAFRRSYNRRVFKTMRVENGNDLVTKVPPVSWGYRHVGIRLHVGALRTAGLFSLKQHETGRYYRELFERYPP